MSELLEDLRRTFVTEEPRFILVSDEEGILVVKNVIIRPYGRYVQLFSYPQRLVSTLSGIHCLLLSQTSSFKFNPLPWERLFKFLGALNLPRQPKEPIAHPPCPSGFPDFDRFTLQRSLPDLKLFLEWKQKESERLSTSPIAPGTTLALHVGAFRKEESGWRCPFPNPPLPQETREFVARNPRRSGAADDILASDGLLNFRVTQVVRHKPNTFFQVFFGVICAPDGSVSPPVCLKLFLDVMFPVDARRLLDEFEDEPAPWCLQTLHYAEDLVRREEAAYDRLQEHQGTLIPHCYGFHRFTLDGSLSAFGALLEIIPGPPLAEAQPWTWDGPRAGDEQEAHAQDPDTKLGFVITSPMWTQAVQIQHVRQCLRALLYAGVDQDDFHSDQILLPDGPEYRPDRDNLVFIDFAFAVQRLGDEQDEGVTASLTGKGNMVLKRLLVDFCEFERKSIGPEFGWPSLHKYKW
ncbi:hypothetical protein C8F01DRAFT_991222 [Mycena amicta]|nr:hypothetical protein C8F01DRAFT_991222 [Mycena amicta]